MKLFSKKLLYIYISISAFMLLIGYCFMLDKENEYLMLVFAINVFISLITVLITFMSIKISIVKLSDKRCDFLEEVMDKKMDAKFNITEDTISSREDNKLKELISILQSEKNKYEEEKSRIQSFITDLSHQVKTPLTNISMYNSTLIEKNLDANQSREFLLLMDGQINKLKWLIDGLIKISRLESELISLSEGEYFIEEVLALALSGAFSEGEKKNICIEVVCDRTIKGIFDLKWTSEALLNLIENAIKYSNKGSNIKVKVIPLDMFVRIDIIDEGIGVHKSFSLLGIQGFQVADGMGLFHITLIPAAIAFLMVIPAEVGVVPFDMAEAETEICEGPLVEYSGLYLALYKLTSQIKAFIMSGLFVALFLGGKGIGVTGNATLNIILNIILFLILTLVVMFISITLVRAIAGRFKINQGLKFFWTVPAVLSLISFLAITLAM